jgi:L-threonylcarbamoyladenylate synthase
MKTEIILTIQKRDRAIAEAVALLRKRELVALPTETVYGLAGDALEPEAVVKIFEAKSRPFFNPLIVHVPNRDWLAELVIWNSRTRPIVEELLNRFWPGPLTILFPRMAHVPDLVTAGLDEVAIRQPRHPIFLEVLQAFGKPLAAPSANRFGRVSPTSGHHVQAELDGRIPLILDAGSTSVGVESTVVRVMDDQIQILRPGPITVEELGEVALTSDGSDFPTKIVAPGQTASHYAPKKQIQLLDSQDPEGDYRSSGLICWGPVRKEGLFRIVQSLSETRDLPEAAQRLFALLREMDETAIDKIYVEPVPEQGIGRAIMNRLRHATRPRD